MNTFIRVGGQTVPGLVTFSARWNDLDSDETGRSVGTGVLNRERIRAAVWEIDLTSNMLTDADIVSLRSMFAPAEVSVEFWVGEWITARMYGAQGSVEVVANPDGTVFWSFSISLTEF